MTRIEHSGAAAPTTLASDITNAALSLAGVNLTSYPTGAIGQFYITIDPGLASEERLLIQSRASNVLTVAGGGRGADGTTAVSHTAGAVIWHSFSAAEADAANAHIEATTGVHGITGSVVGTGGTQTITGKTLTSPVINTPAIAGGSISGSVTSTAVTTGGTLNPATLQQGGVAVPTISSTDTLSNKTLAAPAMTGTATAATLNATTLQQGGVGVVTISGTQTLTGKTLTSPIATDAVISSSAAGTTGLIVKSTAGQSVDTFQVTSNGGTKWLYVTSTGSVQAPINLNVNGSFASNSSSLLVNATVASGGSGTGLTVKSPSSGANPNTIFADSAGSGLSYVDVAGRIVNKIPSVFTSSVGGNTTTSAATELTLATAPAITGDGTSQVKVSIAGSIVTGTVTGDTFDFKIKDGATVIQAVRFRVNSAGNNEPFPSTFNVVTPSAASHTYSVTVTRVGGTGTLTVTQSAGYGVNIAVEQFAFAS